MKNYSYDQQLHPYMLLFIVCFVFLGQKTELIDHHI